MLWSSRYLLREMRDRHGAGILDIHDHLLPRRYLDQLLQSFRLLKKLGIGTELAHGVGVLQGFGEEPS